MYKFSLICMHVYFELETHLHKVHIFRLWAKVAQFEATTTNQFSKRCIFWDYFYVRKMHNLILVYIRPGCLIQIRPVCLVHISSGCLFRGDCREKTEWVLRWPHLKGRPPATTCVEVDSLLFLLVAEFFLYLFFPFLHFLLLSPSGRQTVSEGQRHSL